jgi:cellulose synthase (UDP-forming)
MTAVPHFSVSQQINVRFKRRRKLRRGVAVVYVASSLIYLSWRVTILNADSLAVSIAYFAAELIGFILGLTAILGVWRYTHHQTGTPPPGLSVDVLVPTYREPLHIIRRTVMAARDIRYPHQTWLLDDASRPEVKALAHSLRVHYLARTINTHAKAGNLSHGLRHSTAEFVAVFDADHIAQPHALDTLLGLMADEHIAMVQAPQDFYNIDAFQYLNPRRWSGLWHEGSYFHNLSQSCRESWNAATCLGTGVLYRRSALDSIGGIPTDTVTEDFHTSLKLHKQGWTTRFINEPVAYGIAAADLGEFYKTRHRWAHGNLAALKKERILTCAGLTWKQRWSYLSLGLIYLEGWQQIILFMVPVSALVLGWAPFQISLFNVLALLFYPVFTHLLLQEFGCGFGRFWANELFAMARWPMHILASAALIGRKVRWQASAKNIQGHIRWRLMLPQIGMFCLSTMALTYAAWRLHRDFSVGPLGHSLWILITSGSLAKELVFDVLTPGYSADLVAIAGFWALFNMVRAAIFSAKAIRDAQRSHPFFRFAIPLPITFASDTPIMGQTVSVAEDWISLSVPHLPTSAGKHLAFTLHLPDGPIPCTMQVEHDEGDKIEGRFLWNDASSQDRLAATLYSIGWQREMQHHHAYFMTPSDVLGRLLGQRPMGPEPKRHWDACLLQYSTDEGQGEVLLISRNPKNEQHCDVIAFAPLTSDASYTIRSADKQSPLNTLHIRTETPIASLPQQGLNGSDFRRYVGIISAKQR